MILSDEEEGSLLQKRVNWQIENQFPRKIERSADALQRKSVQYSTHKFILD